MVKSASKGFTLIELIIVIVLLGILAATALPRFVDFSGDARQGAADAVGGAVTTAMNLGHLACQMDSGCSVSTASASITVGGIANVAMDFGYPDLAGIVTLTDIDSSYSYSGGVWTLASGCTVTYVAATNASTPPTVTVSNCTD